MLVATSLDYEHIELVVDKPSSPPKESGNPKENNNGNNSSCTTSGGVATTHKRLPLAAAAMAGFVSAGLVAVGFDAEELHVFSRIGINGTMMKTTTANHISNESTMADGNPFADQYHHNKSDNLTTSDKSGGRERGNEKPMGDTMPILIDQRKSSPFVESKYLLFYPHAGYTNQIIALCKAAELARLVNRTLVLPPVLPHCPDQPMKYAWGCTPNIEPKKASQKAMANAFETVVEGRRRFPSFREIIDFDLFPTEYRFVDMPDFMDIFLEYHGVDVAAKGMLGNRTSEAAQRVKSLILGHFHVGNKSLPLHDLMYSKPGADRNENVRNLFRDNFLDHKVAVVGSCFRLNLATSQILREESITRPFVQPTGNFLRILSHILNHLGTNFAAAHIRLPDIYAWEPELLDPDCSQQKDIVKAYSNLFQKMKELAKPMSLNATDGNRFSSSDVIYLGSNLDRAKECFQTILSKWWNEQKRLEGGKMNSTDVFVMRAKNVITLKDVLAINPGNISSLLKQIKLEDSTKELVLDQLLPGISRILVTESALPGGGSTFAWMLRVRHDYRDEVLSRLVVKGSVSEGAFTRLP